VAGRLRPLISDMLLPLRSGYALSLGLDFRAEETLVLEVRLGPR
jgi:hypothetical protein